jgi:hypothetical protein
LWKGDKGNAFVYADFTAEQLAALVGATGAAGRGISSIERTGGNGAAGTTDTYTITFTDTTTKVFYVYNGADCPQIASLTEKESIEDGDALIVADSAASGTHKKTLWSTIKTALQSLFISKDENGNAQFNNKQLLGAVLQQGAPTGAVAGSIWYFGNSVGYMSSYGERYLAAADTVAAFDASKMPSNANQTAFTDIADADYVPMYDTSATTQKKSLWSNIKSVLKTYFDTLYAALSHTHTKSQITDFPTSMTPTAHKSSHATGQGDAIAPADIGAAAASHTHTKSQVTDFPTSMIPTAHKSSHATGQGDAIAPADIGAASAESVATGWVSAGETWAYVSTDDPTGIFKVQANVAAKYSAGMRIKFTNGGNVIKGIITVVNAYNADAAGYTYIKFLHEIDPADCLALALMANSAITANYYSTQKAPQGFPLKKSSWSVVTYSDTDTSQSSPAAGTYYNFLNLTLPIGAWDVSIAGNLAIVATANQNIVRANVTLSTGNNTKGDNDLTCFVGMNGFAYTTDVYNLAAFSQVYRSKTLYPSSKTVYYLNASCFDGSAAGVYLLGSLSRTEIRAVCAYL